MIFRRIRHLFAEKVRGIKHLFTEKTVHFLIKITNTLQNPQFLCDPTCLNRTFYLKLAQNLLTVPADRVHTDRKLAGNLLAHQTLIYQPENLFLSVRQDLCILLTA